MITIQYMKNDMKKVHFKQKLMGEMATEWIFCAGSDLGRISSV